MSPAPSNMTPDPSPVAVRISTTEGSTRRITVTYACCSATAVPGLAAAVPGAAERVAEAVGDAPVRTDPVAVQAAEASATTFARIAREKRTGIGRAADT